ncbi:MAG: N-formylglutamate amidohydrolase [Pseudomonadota bacterium]
MKDDSTVAHDAYRIIGAERSSDFVVTCDHASNAVPFDVAGGDLGLSLEDMNRHIAYDVGAAGVATAMADALDAPAVFSTFSRLVIDPNRGEDDPTLVMQLYDGTIIPANRDLNDEMVQYRLNRFYRPYHDAYGRLVASRNRPAVVAVHSFTPRLAGRPARPWQIGLLSGHDRRLSNALFAVLREDPALVVGDNQPYSGHLPGDSIDRQALRPGHLNTLIEVRSDLIESPEDQKTWGIRLADMLQRAVEMVT